MISRFGWQTVGTTAICAIFLIWLAIYLSRIVLRGIKEKRVPRRLYMAEEHKESEYATRHERPIEYWLALLTYTVIVAVSTWGELCALDVLIYGGRESVHFGL